VSRRRIAVRRGVVLALLVISVLIFTTFFREDEGGFLHQFKGTIGAVVTPVQEAAVAAVQPLKDGWNWFAELRGARDRANRLAVENAALQAALIKQDLSAEQIKSFREALAISDDGPDGYSPVSARLLGRPQDLSQRVKLDKGRDDKVVVNSLVFAPAEGTTKYFGALVGLVTSTTGGSATVTLITDPSISIGARLVGGTKPLGLLRATSSGELILDQVPRSELIAKDDVVVTAGYGTLRFPSPYPPGVPIGKVSSVGGQEPGETQTVQVTPFRDPSELSLFTIFVPTNPEARRRAGLGG
jgi:rod shape-determining protein MreC